MIIKGTRPKKYLTGDKQLWEWPDSANDSSGRARPQSEVPKAHPGDVGMPGAAASPGKSGAQDVAETDKVFYGLRVLAVFGPVFGTLLIGMGVPWMYALLTCAPTVIALVLEIPIAWKKRGQNRISRQSTQDNQVTEAAILERQTSGTVDDKPRPVRPGWRSQIVSGWRRVPYRTARPWSRPTAAANALGMREPPTILMLWPFSDDTAQDDVYAYRWHEIGPILTLTHAECLPTEVHDRYKWSGTVSVLCDLDEVKAKLLQLDRAPARRKKDFFDVETHAAMQEHQEAIDLFEQWKEAASATGAGFLRPPMLEGQTQSADYFGYDIVPLIAHHDLWRSVIQYLVTQVDLVVVNLAGLPDRDDAVGAGLEYELELLLAWKPGPRVALIGSGRLPPRWLRKRVVQWSPAEGHLETYLWHAAGHDDGSAPLAARVMTALRESYYLGGDD